MTDQYPLSFPIKRYETATSYASRLARHCGLYSPVDLCLDFGFYWKDFISGDDALYSKLSRIGGANLEQMKKWAIRSQGGGRFSIAGHQCSKGTLVRSRLRVCPICLQEDVGNFGPNGVFRRYFWQLKSIRTCALHSAELLELPPEKYTIYNYDFVGQVTKRWAYIKRASATAALQRETAFERYLFDRLEGSRQYPFLDGLSLHTATKLCETLGFVMLFGPTAKLRTASNAQMHQAGQAGFEALQSGESGLRDVLHSLRSGISKMTMRQKSDFGSFYEWLRLSKFHQDVEPIRRIVRDYVFEHYPVPDGFEILGRPCAQRSVYTVEAACKALGIERKRIGRYLVGDGIAERNATMDGISLRRTLHRTDVLRISSEVCGRISPGQALDFLKIKDRALLDLCELGLVAQELDALDQRPKYEREKLQTLLDTAASRITVPPGSAADLVPAAEVARRLRCRTADVLALVFTGKLKTVSGDVLRTGLEGIKVDIGQVRCALPTWDLPGITRTQASTALRVTYQTINYLIEEGLLRSARMRNPKSRQFITGICDGSVDAFLSTYDTLGLMARRYKRPPGPFGCHLEAKGICPLETPRGISWLYERRGLEARLRKIGISCASWSPSENASQAQPANPSYQ
ncbi:TniQ family protein [Phaeobacter inhibens]|uniref:TniQ family protein n=1 Tax=Phaeobacter inhibens TaxID=221822 RepID=UPI0021A757CF|nr:TniQ family protein [Phaeobacter inhibens]UWR60193.1 TniQ family protein [Phaeobacter inhibens]